MEECEIMMEKIEREIYYYLKRHPNESYNVLGLKKVTGFGYPACLKYVLVLHAKGLINIRDFGNNKQVSFKKKEVFGDKNGSRTD